MDTLWHMGLPCSPAYFGQVDNTSKDMQLSSMISYRTYLGDELMLLILVQTPPRSLPVSEPVVLRLVRILDLAGIMHSRGNG